MKSEKFLAFDTEGAPRFLLEVVTDDDRRLFHLYDLYDVDHIPEHLFADEDPVIAGARRGKGKEKLRELLLRRKAKNEEEERRGKGVRHCKKCGKPGHRSDGCKEEGAG